MATNAVTPPPGYQVEQPQTQQSQPQAEDTSSLPPGYTVETTQDSMSPDYQFQHRALSGDEIQQLQKANLSRPLYRKILGLPSNDPDAQALEAKDQAHQAESAQHSSYVQQQMTDKAIGGAVVASAPAVAGAVQAAPAVAAAAAPPIARTIATVGPPVGRAIGTMVKIAKSPITREVLGAAKDIGIAGKILGFF